MADVFTRKGYDLGASTWTVDLGGTSTNGYIAFRGSAWAYGIEVNGYNDKTYATNAGAVTEGDEINNIKYVNPVASVDKVSINGASAVTLSTTNVATTDCTIKWTYTNTSAPGSTTLSNVKLFAYNGSDINVAPVELKFFAFERQGSAINTTVGVGISSWDHTGNGINTVTYALPCETKTGADTHDYFFGISVSPQAHGTNKQATIRLSCDAQ